MLAQRNELGQFVKGHVCLTKIHDFCTVEDCNRKHCAKGYCQTHYFRWKYGKHGEFDIPIGMLKGSNLGRVCKRLSPTKKPTSYDIYWAAGIFEGEGCFQGGINFSPTVAVYQADKWILEKLKDLFGGSIYQPTKRVGYGKAPFTWGLNGTRARGFVMTIFPLLSPNRQKPIREELMQCHA